MCVYLPMRDVMETNGGFCASGGPYAIAPGHTCTSDNTWLLTVAPFAGIALAGLLVAASAAWSGGRVAGVGTLLWFALFGTLGWNFLDLGIHPPGGTATSGAWIGCAVLFWVMALGGLAYSVMVLRDYFFPGSVVDDGPKLPPIVRAAVNVQAQAPAPAPVAAPILNPTSFEPTVTPAATTTAPDVDKDVGSPWLWTLALLAGSGVGVWLGVALANAV